MYTTGKPMGEVRSAEILALDELIDIIHTFAARARACRQQLALDLSIANILTVPCLHASTRPAADHPYYFS